MIIKSENNKKNLNVTFKTNMLELKNCRKKNSK